MSEKPSLHEIAAMPFPASMLATRKHYDSKWHTEQTDDGKGRRPWSVKIEYETKWRTSETIEVFASCEADAVSEAEEAFEKKHDYDTNEVISVEARDSEALAPHPVCRGEG